jgi:glycosyltransferase involved in cell wall biosynthesis
MHDLPLVSVLMTSYNREKYIAEAIESILNSTYQNFELIIVDDKSKDDTVKIAEQYALQDSRIEVYINETNLGDYQNRNKAATYATGKYIKYIDADDMIYPHGLDVMVKMMEKFPEAGYGFCTVAPNRKHIFPLHLNPKETYNYHYINKGFLFNRSPLSSIIKTEVFRQQNGFIEQRMVGDFELWHRLALSSSVVLMPQGLIWYRVHENQEMSSHKNYLMDYLSIAEKYVGLSEMHNDIKEAILDKLRRNQLVTLFKNPMRFSLKDRVEILKNSNIKLNRILMNTSILKRL